MMSDNTATNHVVSSRWLNERLDRVKVVDSTIYLPGDNRDSLVEFQKEHIPGALHINHQQISQPDKGLPFSWPESNTFASAMEELGISNKDAVVCYEASSPIGATRLWWMLRAFGHTNVKILDGGLTKWKQEGLPLESGEAQAQPRSRFHAEYNPSFVTSFAEMFDAVINGSLQVLDARHPDHFSGKVETPDPNMRSGHMPGAINIPFFKLTNQEHCLRPVEQLKAIFEDAGIDPGRPVVTTCGGGISAATLLLALEVAGYHNISLYDGSWAEWGTREDTPVDSSTQ